MNPARLISRLYRTLYSCRRDRRNERSFVLGRRLARWRRERRNARPAGKQNPRCVLFSEHAALALTLPYPPVESAFVVCTSNDNCSISATRFLTFLWQLDSFVAAIHRLRRWTMPRFQSNTRNEEHLIDLRHLKFRYEPCHLLIIAIYEFIGRMQRVFPSRLIFTTPALKSSI